MSIFREGKNNPKKLFETFMTLVVVSLITMGAVFDSGMKEITILRTDNFSQTAESYIVKTRQENVSGLFDEKDIIVDDDEILTFSMADSLTNGDTLEIKQGRAVTISADGMSRKILTSQTNVADALMEAGIAIGENDWADPGFETPVTDGTDGEETIVYRVMYNGDNEVYREEISREVTKEATATIITVGTKVRPAVPTASKQGKTFTYSRKFTVKATAYDTSPQENGGYSKTALGLTPGFGIVAVDPRVIPLGSKLYIESEDDGKSWSYGYCIAGDTGGAIKGNRIDLCYNSRSECIQFGRRNATVYVLDA